MGRYSVARSLMCLALYVVGILACCSSVATAAEGSGRNGPSFLTSGMAGPSVESLTGEQRSAEEQTRRSSPQAIEARKASSLTYHSLGNQAAREAITEAFPNLINEPDSTLPQLHTGQQVTGYINQYAAQLTEQDGQRALAISDLPIAHETASGQWIHLT